MGAIGQATNQLGQLFVDIGVGGLGQTLKALNSVSATFLLTKNAATQALTPIINIGKEAANSAVGLGKMAAALGTTTINAQKLQYYLKQYKSEGLEGDVASLQQLFTRAQKGLGGFSGEFSTSWQMIGLKKNWTEYNGTFEDTLQFIQDVKDALKTSGLSENEKVMHLQNLGLGNWKYLFEKEDFDINKALSISDETIANLQEVSEETNKLNNEIDQLKKNSTGNFAKNVGIPALKDLNTSLTTDTPITKSRAKARTLTRVGAMGMGAGAGAAAGSILGPLGAVAGLGIGGILGLAGNEKLLNYLETINEPSLYSDSVQDAALPPLPSVGDVNVSVTNNIKRGADGQPEFDYIDVDATSGGRKVDVNAYTTHNNTGL